MAVPNPVEAVERAFMFHPGPLRLDLFCVSSDPDGRVVAALEDLRSFRAEVYYDGDRRPEFRSADGSFNDAQDLDVGSWHFVVRAEPAGSIVGYIRLATPSAIERYQSRLFLGPRRFAGVLAAERVQERETFEAGRLAVDPAFRGLGLGAYLTAAAMAAARHLGGEAIIGTSATADGVYRLYRRFNLRLLESTRAYVAHYREDVCIVVNRTSDGAGEFEELVHRLRVELAPRLEQAHVEPRRPITPARYRNR